jgi:hypothetical protein
VLLVQTPDQHLRLCWAAVVLQGRQLPALHHQLLLLLCWAGRAALELLQQLQRVLLLQALLLLSCEASFALPLLVPHLVLLLRQAQVLLTGPLGPY